MIVDDVYIVRNLLIVSPCNVVLIVSRRTKYETIVDVATEIFSIVQRSNFFLIPFYLLSSVSAFRSAITKLRTRVFYVGTYARIFDVADTTRCIR